MFPWVIIFVLFFVEAPGQLPPLNPALGQNIDRQQQWPAPSSKCRQCHVDSRVDEAEHRLVKHYSCSRIMFLYLPQIAI